MRWKLITILTVILALVSGVLVLQFRLEANLAEQENNKLQELVQLQTEYQTLLLDPSVLKRLGNQGVDDYILNLNKQLTLLRSQYALLVKKDSLEKDPEVRQIITEDISQVKMELDRYILDRTFMDYAGISWLAVHSRPEVKDFMRKITIARATVDWEEPLFPETPEYVKTGQVIGAQGCSGVCSGTHLHFSVLQDRVPQDPCKYLPKRQMIRWGVLASCGVDKPVIQWPLSMPWIVSQKYGKKNSVTGTPHLGMDVIDQDGVAVKASHGGWYYSLKRSCAGAVICNKGGVKIALVCENQGCETGLVTEYWHLDWMQNGQAPTDNIPISEFED